MPPALRIEETKMNQWGGTSVAPSAVDDERRANVLKLILYDLNSAIAPRDHRMMALRTAVAEFDHDDEDKHDEELDLHADKILFQKLAFAFQVDRGSDEVALICTALEMVYRASRARVALSFSELRESILPLFVEMLGKPLHMRRQEELEDALKEIQEIEARERELQEFKKEQERKEREDKLKNDQRQQQYIDKTLKSLNGSKQGTSRGTTDYSTSETDDMTFGISTKADDPYLSSRTDAESSGQYAPDDATFGISTKAGDTFLRPSHASSAGSQYPQTIDESDETLTRQDQSTHAHSSNFSSLGTSKETQYSQYQDDQTNDDNMTFGISTKAGDTFLHPSGSSHYDSTSDGRTATNSNYSSLGASNTSYSQPSSGASTAPSRHSKSTYEVETVGDEQSVDDDYTYADVSVNEENMTYQPEELSTVMEGDEEESTVDGSSVYKKSAVGAPANNQPETIHEEEEHADENYHPADGNRHPHEDSHHGDDTSETARSLREKMVQREKQAETDIGHMRNELEMIRMEEPTNNIAVSRLLQVLRYFSRVLSAMVPMAHHPGLLDALVYQLQRQPNDLMQPSHMQQQMDPDEFDRRRREEEAELTASRVDAIATIVNLACAEENKVKMVYHRGLLDSVIRLALNDPSEEAREHAAIVIMNLAYADETKVEMVEHEGLLNTLVSLIADKSPFTRRYASAALFTLACVVANTERMAKHCDGEILESLRRVLSEDPVDEARINAAEALFNMARNNTEETVQIMGEHPRLFESIAKAVLTDYSADVRVYCARALEWMSADVHHPMPCHRTLLAALTVSSQWTKTSCIAEAFKTQATLSENRRAMAMHDGLLRALANLALLEGMNDADVRASAIAALEMISREGEARRYMVQNELVMSALTHASFSHEGPRDNEEGSTVTMVKDALKNLATAM